VQNRIDLTTHSHVLDHRFAFDLAGHINHLHAFNFYALNGGFSAIAAGQANSQQNGFE